MVCGLGVGNRVIDKVPDCMSPLHDANNKIKVILLSRKQVKLPGPPH